ncbi:glycosyltransferase [Gordonia sp. CPCC 206044]|uniref:nucleotide disphospho-sugar-binding domain-containing protein n=1 Tax=Gordonia sp. CPCC 206044 TaxID=3140793 RepID=UPI003AF3A927
MRVGFALHGSRGDIQPAVALAVGLVDRGHEVRLAVPDNLVAAVERTGLPTQSIGPDTAELLRSPLIREQLHAKDPRVRFRALREVGAYGATESEAAISALADVADNIVCGPVGQERAAAIAESRQIAYAGLNYCPVRPNSSVSPTAGDWPRWTRRPAWSVAERVYHLSVRGAEADLRRRLDLAPAKGPLSHRLRSDGFREIQAYDPLLFKGLDAEWGAQRPVVGSLVADRNTRLALNDHQDAATVEALDWADAGPAPVYVGFGSMPVDKDRVITVVDALSRQGLRVIAHTPHPVGADGVHHVADAVDHEVLLPHCAGAVHHGGAGTTGAATRAGIPSVIGWLSADQPLWAGALRRAGVGGGAPLSRLGATHLEPLTDPETRRAARELADRLIPPTDALSSACAVLSDQAARPYRR